MKFNPLKMVVQFTVIFILYFVFAAYQIVWLYFVLIGVGFVVLLIYNLFHSRGIEMYMDITCNPIVYLQKIEKRHTKRTPEDEYQLSFAYAHIYRGKYEVAQQHFDSVDLDNIENQVRYRPIHIRIATKFAFRDSNLLALENLRNSAEQMGDILLQKYIETHCLILEEKYAEAVEVLMKYIPEQKSRLMLIELEYFLGLCYSKTDRLEDALAVLEFVVNKKYPIECTDLAYELYIEIKE